jgi:hypothetical protein
MGKPELKKIHKNGKRRDSGQLFRNSDHYSGGKTKFSLVFNKFNE